MELLESLNWDIDIKPIECDGTIVPGFQGLKRTDNGELLHISKTSYHPTLNTQLISILERLSEITGFEIAGYNEFSNGKKVLGYLKSNTIQIAEHDLDNYLVVGNSHDGTQTTYIALATVYGPNKNAFGKILKHKILHTVNAGQYLSEFEDKLKDFKQLELGVHQKFNQWSNIQITDKNIENLTKKFLEINVNTKIENVSTRRRNIYYHVRECIEKETGLLGNNLFAWFNGITYYTTHDRSSKEKVFGNVIGAISYFNELAFNIAIKFESELI